MMVRAAWRQGWCAWIVCLSAAAALAAAPGCRSAIHVMQAALRDDRTLTPWPEGCVDDASRLNSAPVLESINVEQDAAKAEAQIAALLERARNGGLRVSIAGARHTMGGHTIYPGGIALNMQSLNAMRFDDERNVLHVQAGARWEEVVPFLDARGRSVAVMQSNNSFTVGGSVSANCHGWQPNRPPIASTVRAMRVMTADGVVHRCSRDENAELFTHVLGGYGLFGVILDVELDTVPNVRYRAERHRVGLEDVPEFMAREVRQHEEVGMAYARLCVAPSHFLNEALVTLYVIDPCDARDIPPLKGTQHATLKRAIFRGSARSEYGKELRWQAELELSDRLSGRYVSRNQLLNDSVALYQDCSDDTTDILHEYFVPPEHFVSFVKTIRELIPQHDVDLLNVTVRHVLEDRDTVLRYADGEMLTLVLLFNQQRTPEAEAAMEACTQALIDAALAHEGRYYLPYRLHATREQFERAYPMAHDFFEAKRKYDPQEIFQNQFYVKYGSELENPMP